MAARKRTNASLAAESTGGAVTLIFNSVPNTSPISSREARGCSFTDMITPSACGLRNGATSNTYGSIQRQKMEPLVRDWEFVNATNRQRVELQLTAIDLGLAG